MHFLGCLFYFKSRLLSDAFKSEDCDKDGQSSTVVLPWKGVPTDGGAVVHSVWVIETRGILCVRSL